MNLSAGQLLLRRLLEQAGGASSTGYVLVIDGDGLEDLPKEITTAQGSYAVHRVNTELGLRHLLWQAKGAPLIAVLPEELASRIQKAPDLLRRARNQRVHALLINDVLEVLLGVRVVGADSKLMQDLALEYVSKLGTVLNKSNRTLPTVIDHKLLRELLVDVSVGDDVRKRTPAQLLAQWVMEPPQWKPNISTLVREAMPPMHGDEGRVLAWALDDPEVRLREVVTHGAMLTVEVQELPKPVWGPFWKAGAEAPLNMERPMLRKTLSSLAEATLGELGDRAAPLLAEADRRSREHFTPAQLQTSRVLPLAFADRCHSLATQAAAGKPITAVDLAWLANHRAAGLHRSELKLLEAIARISRFLDQPFSPKSSVLEQVQDYQRNGAFAELAMTQLRRALANSASYHVEAQKVLAACRERRDRENQHFAQTLAGNYEASLHAEGLTPLHRLWKRTVAPVWQSNPAERLFLVVLDGCSYPVFLQIIYDLAKDQVFPTGMRAAVDGRVEGLPAISPLPTITSHARGAIFLGQLPDDPLVAETVFRDQDEAKTDKARFNQNAALSTRTRKLFLKGDLADGGQALLAAVQDSSIGVVSAVFNAVDDQIGSSNTGAMVRLAPEDITAFKPALRAALNAGRKVLVTADHGHSPFVDTKHRVGAGKTPRYVALQPNDPVPDGFIAMDVAGLGGPPERRAFAWRSGAYLGSPQVGFHGGCSLEEMVVPLAWIEQNGLQADEPSWWYGSGAVAAPVYALKPQVISEPPVPTTEVASHITQKRSQLSLFNPGERASALPIPAELLARLSDDEKTILVLLRETGTARATELAERVKKPVNRLNGLMRTLRRTLFEKGLVLFTDETLNSGETMYRYDEKERT